MDASISMQHLIQAESATILGNTYVNYDLPESSIDFYVVERGFITFMAGDYYTGNNAFFSLHQIFRSGEEQKITAIKEITKVYRHSSLGASRPYIYQYSDGTYTNADGTYTGATTLAADYEQAFDCSWITNPTNGSAFDNQYIYYFEIPCNVGEYALGSVDGKTGAYLLYLDIASNGGDIIQSTVSAEGNEVTDCFKVEYRNVPDTVEYSILQFSVDAPETTDFTKFAVTVNFESNVEDEEHGDAFSKGIYTITVNNETGEDVVLYVFLVDDDNNINNNFNFAYRFKYTNETTRTAETVMTTTNLDFWKSVAGFRVPSTGVAEEVSYQ